MYDIELDLSVIAIEHGKEPFEDKEKLFEALKRDVIMLDEDKKILQELYDSGVAQRLLEAEPSEQAEELALCYPILVEKFSLDYLQQKKAATALVTFAGAIGFPKENVEAFVNDHKLKLSPLYGDDGVWSRKKGLELLPAWEDYIRGVRSYNQGDEDLGLALLEKASDAGSVSATLTLGNLMQSLGDYKKAREYLLRAIELGEPMALIILGTLDEMVLGNYTEAEKLYRLFAKEDESTSLCYLGQLKANRGDLKEAEKLWLKSAKLGNYAAMFDLGILYKEELGDNWKAISWLKRSYKAGWIPAARSLSQIYTSLGDYSEAERWGLRAVKMDTPDKYDTMNELGLLYRDYLNNPKKAYQWFNQAYERGNLEATINMGHYFRDVLQDYEKAEQYYLKAIQMGDTNTIVVLGDLYDDKLDDQEKAQQWYLKGVSLNDDLAMHNLGVMYMNHGEIEKAMEMFHKAIERAERLDSMNNLGYLYGHQFKNEDEALKWLLKAAEAGHPKAYNSLGYLYEIDFKDYDKAEEYYHKAIYNGYPEAIINLRIVRNKKKGNSTNSVRKTTRGSIKKGTTKKRIKRKTTKKSSKKRKRKKK